MRTNAWITHLACCLLLPAFFLPAAAEDTPPAVAALAPLQDPPELKALKYRSIGPAWGGRVSRVAGVPGDPRIYYAATASGGVWKSSNGGYTWQGIFDDQPIASIGSIAIAPSDPNVVYVGSGEANIRGNVAPGNGIYKSVDAGKTWSHVWQQVGQIGTMAVDPRNPEIAFAAVLGHAFGPNPERGVYRTTDGGKSWQQVLKKDADTGASDIAISPSNPHIVFAGLWQTRRRPWELTSGGPGSGLYMSRDGGESWKQLTGKGLPAGIWGKVGVAVAPSDGRRVYALIEAEQGGLYRSDDGGESWTYVNPSRELRQRAWYYSTITVHPTKPDELWCPQVPMLRSIDGGKTFSHVDKIHHGDHHDVWFDPLEPKRIISANDGGVDISLDGGESWFAPALPIGQFYHLSVDRRVPFHVAGAMQDIGTAQAPSNSLHSEGIRNTDWVPVGGGEAGHVVSDPADPNIVYAGEYGGYISRYDRRTGQARNVSIYPENPSGHGAEDLRYRFQWTAPIAVSHHDPKILYHAANVLFRSRDGGQSWQAISPDLTRNDRSKQKWSGGPITGDNTGVEIYGTIFAVAESTLDAGLIWAGSDDGLVHVTRDGGANWANVTAAMAGLPEWGTVRAIEPSRFAAATAYVVVDAHRLDDYRPFLYKTTDLGQSWSRLDAGLPADVHLHVVREDSSRAGLLYVGTERGVVFSRDDGRSWQSLKLNLPTVAVHDLAVKDHSLVVGTMGRSVWILDDLVPLRELSDAITGQPIHLFSAPPAIRWRYASAEADRWSGENPPRGASIYYWLKDKPAGEITLQIFDPKGAVVNTLSSTPIEVSGSSEYVKEETDELKKLMLPKDAGVQRAAWDLTWTGAEMIPGAKLDAGYPRSGPLALPGGYTIKLSAGELSATTTLTVLADPRVQLAEQGLADQLAFALEVRDAISRLSRGVIQLHSMRQQLIERNALIERAPAHAALHQASARLIAELAELEAELHNPKAEVVYDVLAFQGGAKLYSRLAPLFDWVHDSDGPPTQGMREVFADQKRELDRLLAELERLLSEPLAQLNQQALDSGVPTILRPQ